MRDMEIIWSSIFHSHQLKMSYTPATVGMGNQITSNHDCFDRSSHQFSKQTKADMITCAFCILDLMCVVLLLGELRVLKGERCVLTERILCSLNEMNDVNKRV